MVVEPTKKHDRFALLKLKKKNISNKPLAEGKSPLFAC